MDTGSPGGISNGLVWPDHMSFHHAATFVGVWVMVLLVAPRVLMELRPILEPLLWAFFLMMGLLPVTDCIEGLLLKAFELVMARRCRRRVSARPGKSEKALAASAKQDAGSGESHSDESDTHEETEVSVGETRSCGKSLGALAGMGDEEDDDEPHQCQCARMVAVVVVVFGFFALMLTFGYMVWASAWHMQQQWRHYERGAVRLAEKFDGFHDWLEEKLGNQLPKGFMDNTAKKGLARMEEFVQAGLGETMKSTSETLFETLMMMLYMMFWLCEPLHIGERVSTLFRRYILLKGLASFMYAFCVWLLLQFMSVDLAPFFGAVTFVFNWIPEVGPLFAMMLPLPVILFDGRLETPVYTMAVALGGQLCLKFFFGNVVEVKLVERQQDMHMHPVIILYSVAFFGWIWGATGMLLSVPIMAAFKATVSVVPQAYRDPILIAIEGDKRAPARWQKRREKELRQQEESASGSASMLRGTTHQWWHGASAS